MPPADFLAVADTALDAMVERARALGAKGAAVVAWAELAPARGWVSRLRIVGAMATADSNLVAIAYSKAAEMADTRADSGGGIRPPLRGEHGYRGGVIAALGDGHAMAVFSGASGAEDVDISQAGMAVFAQRYR
jgi:hypothetical protein